MASSPPVPRIAAPRIFRVSASTTTFMKPCVSAFSMARPTFVMGRVPTRSGRPLARASVSVAPTLPERRIDVERVRRHAVAQATLLAVEEVRGQDLEVVVRGVREGAAAVAVAERPDAGHVGRELVVDRDVAARVHRDAGRLEPEVVRVRAAADREQHVRAHDGRLALLAVDAHGHALLVRRQADALGARAHRDALGQQDAPDRLGHVLVLAGDEPRHPLDHGHARAEAPVHLRELEADVAAADDHQVRRHPVEGEHGAVGQIRHRADPRQVGHRGASADVDEHPRRVQELVADPDAVFALEPGVAPHERAARQASQPLLEAPARVRGDGVGARLDPGHVDRHRRPSSDDPVLGGAAGDVGRVGARHQRLGRHAAGVDAGAAHELALDERDRHAGRGETADERRARLAGADDDRVERPHRSAPAISRAPPSASASSVKAAGRSLPKAVAIRARRARPPSVPATAPRAPATRPPTREPPETPIAAPLSAPVTMRAPNCGGHRAARRRGPLVVDELAEREERQDPGRPRVAEEGQPAAAEVEPAQPCRPAHRRRRRHGAHSRHDADQDREQIENDPAFLHVHLRWVFHRVSRSADGVRDISS